MSAHGDWQSAGDGSLSRLAECRGWLSTKTGRVQGVAVYVDWQSEWMTAVYGDHQSAGGGGSLANGSDQGREERVPAVKTARVADAVASSHDGQALATPSTLLSNT